MTRALLLLALLLAGCDSERRQVRAVCVDCFDYDGYWRANYSTVTTDSNGQEDEAAGETWLTIDQLANAVVFSGVVAIATEGGLYFDSGKTFDHPFVGKLTSEFSGESDPLDPLAINLTANWTYHEFDPPVFQTIDYRFALEERVYP